MCLRLVKSVIYLIIVSLGRKGKNASQQRVLLVTSLGQSHQKVPIFFNALNALTKVHYSLLQKSSFLCHIFIAT